MKLLLNFVEEAEKEGNEQLFTVYNYPITLQENIDILLNHPQLFLVCDICERKLNLSASVLLTDSPIDFCFTCFLKHDLSQKPYEYYVRPSLNLTITEDGWNILSELMLMTALQRFGYGNWCQVKNYLDYHGHNFTSQQIENHFSQFYMTQDLKPLFSKHFIENNRLNPYMHEPHTIKQIITATTDAEPPETTIKAYNAKRQEHLFDYDQQAQFLVCDLEFLPTDTQEQQELKLMKLEEYDYRVKERQKRQAFVVQHQLLTEQYGKKLLSNGIVKNSIKKQMDCYSRFMSCEESNNLVSYLTMQSTLKAAILELNKQRRRLEVPSFEKAFRRMEDKKERRSLQIGVCPTQLKVTAFPISQNANLKRSASLDIAEVSKKIRAVGFLEKQAKMSVISWGNQ